MPGHLRADSRASWATHANLCYSSTPGHHRSGHVADGRTSFLAFEVGEPGMVSRKQDVTGIAGSPLRGTGVWTRFRTPPLPPVPQRKVP